MCRLTTVVITIGLAVVLVDSADSINSLRMPAGGRRGNMDTFRGKEQNLGRPSNQQRFTTDPSPTHKVDGTASRPVIFSSAMNEKNQVNETMEKQPSLDGPSENDPGRVDIPDSNGESSPNVGLDQRPFNRPNPPSMSLNQRLSQKQFFPSGMNVNDQGISEQEQIIQGSRLMSVKVPIMLMKTPSSSVSPEMVPTIKSFPAGTEPNRSNFIQLPMDLSESHAVNSANRLFTESNAPLLALSDFQFGSPEMIFQTPILSSRQQPDSSQMFLGNVNLARPTMPAILESSGKKKNVHLL